MRGFVSRNRAIRQESLEDELSGYMTRMTDWTQRNGGTFLSGGRCWWRSWRVSHPKLVGGQRKGRPIGWPRPPRPSTRNQTEAAATKLTEVIQRYGSTRSGNRARLLMATWS